MTNLHVLVREIMRRILAKDTTSTVTASSLARATMGRFVDEGADPLMLEERFEEFKQIAGDLLADLYDPQRRIANEVFNGDRRLRRFCEWEMKRPPDHDLHEWHHARGFDEILASPADMKRAAELLRRMGEALHAEGDALKRYVKCRKLGLSVVTGGKEGPDDAAA